MNGRNFVALTSICLQSMFWVAQACAQDGHIDPSIKLHRHYLDFANHPQSTFNVTSASGGLATITGKLLKCDSRVAVDQDVACGVKFGSHGLKGQFGGAADGLDVITSAAEMATVLANTTAHVKVVTQIGYCGGVGVGIVGCAPKPGSSIVIVNSLPQADTGEVLAHEFGHNQGLSHRDSPGTPIMHTSTLGNNEVNLAECAAFHNGHVVVPNAGTWRPTDIGFVVDDTGSMSQEIGGVRDALTNFIALSSGCNAFQLTTFKDSVSILVPTTDTAVILSEVNGLVAGGGDDCPESSVSAMAIAADKIKDSGRAFLITDATPSGGVEALNGVISALRSRSVRVDVTLSSDCGTSGLLTTTLRKAGIAVPAYNEPGKVTNDSGKVITAAPLLDGPLQVGGLTELSMGDDDSQEVALPFAFPFAGQVFSSVFIGSNGYLTFFEPDTGYGSSPGGLLSGTSRIAAQWRDLNPAAGGIVRAGSVGSDFVVEFEAVPAFNSLNVTNFSYTLRPDGTFALKYGTSSVADGVTGVSPGGGIIDPGATDLSSAVQPLGGPDGTIYELFGLVTNPFDLANATLEFAPVTAIPGTLITNGVEALSRLALETGGIFTFVPEVNSGTPSGKQQFENTILNLLLGANGESIALVEPSKLVQGAIQTVDITGSGTAFETGTTVAFSGTGVSASDVRVISPTKLQVDVIVQEDAALGFRDIEATVNSGIGIQIVSGVGPVEVVAAPIGPTILGVSPSQVTKGTTLNLMVFGLATSFSDLSTVNLGPGIIVNYLNANSTTAINANITVSSNTVAGFRDVSVTSDSEFAGENLIGPLLVLTAPSVDDAGSIVSINPGNGVAGELQLVTITGEGTGFLQGVSQLTFSGEDIDVQSVQVVNATTLQATIYVSKSTAPGFRDVRVTTNEEIAVALQLFQISGHIIFRSSYE